MMEHFNISPEFLNNYSSIHTRNSYESDIQKFIEYLHDYYPAIQNFENVTRDHLINYRNYLVEFGGIQAEGHAPKSVSRKLSALTSYFHFLVETKVIEHNPATSVKRPRREVKKPTNALSAIQVRELLDSVKMNPKAGIMHYALLMTFFTTGLRKSEILYLKRKHYREINDYKVLEYVGKGGKIGQKVVHPETIEAIDAYLEMMKNKGRELIDEDWLFQPTHNPSNPSNINKPLNPNLQLLPKGTTLSIDTYRVETMRVLLNYLRDYPFKIIWNDVSGILNSETLLLLKEHPTLDYVFCHSNIKNKEEAASHAKVVVNWREEDAVDELLRFFRAGLSILSQAEIDLKRVILDPAFGFSKTSAINRKIFNDLPFVMGQLSARWLIGISRKSFLQQTITGGLYQMSADEKCGVEIESLHLSLITAFTTKLELHLKTSLEIYWRIHNFEVFRIFALAQNFGHGILDA